MGDVVHLSRGGWPKPLRPVSCATRRRRDALLVSLSSRGSIRSRSRAWAISVAIFEPQLRPPSVSIGVTLERKSCPPWCDIILDGSVIAARGVLGAMKGVEDIRGEVGRGAGGRFMLTAC